ncbi:hypothetical protein JXC34_04220, partial [Candidatus Woesearchaeota archaeon]|nr:hypothetical protein [Candidatus Woesearchaeota archaeon]
MKYIEPAKNSLVGYLDDFLRMLTPKLQEEPMIMSKHSIYEVRHLAGQRLTELLYEEFNAEPDIVDWFYTAAPRDLAGLTPYQAFQIP